MYLIYDIKAFTAAETKTTTTMDDIITNGQNVLPPVTFNVTLH